jgi:large subunit ribosomal protein L10
MREEKSLLLDEINGIIEGAQAILFASYSKLEPNFAAPFRDTLRQQGNDLQVVKKRVLIKALRTRGIELNICDLEGHIALFSASHDPLGMAKLVFNFSRDHKDSVLLKVLGGRFEGCICSAADVQQIAELPSKQEMRAQILALFEEPMRHNLRTMEALLTSVIYCLTNKTDQVSKSV